LRFSGNLAFCRISPADLPPRLSRLPFYAPNCHFPALDGARKRQ
jgi:hypothetical protein